MLNFEALVIIVTLFDLSRAAFGQTVLHAATDIEKHYYEVWGQPTNNIQPLYVITKSSGDWQADISLRSITNDSHYSWLGITNRVAGKLRVWLDNGTELVTTNTDVTSAFRLPNYSSTSKILGAIPRSLHSSSWLPFSTDWKFRGNTNLINYKLFYLLKAFPPTGTNECIVQVAPLLYKIEPTTEKAQLVEFPPLKMRLTPSGEAKIIEGASESSESVGP